MSDIGLYGLAAALVGLAMLALAMVGFLGEVWRWRKQRDRDAFLAFPRWAPLAYGVLALVMLYLVEEGPVAWKSTLDDIAWFVAGGGLLLWGIFRIRFRSRQSAA